MNSRLNELDGLINISNALVEVTKLNIEDANSLCAAQASEYDSQKLSRYEAANRLGKLRSTSWIDSSNTLTKNYPNEE